jgi:glycosyltransferase involved in cell wall biosynthesis
MVSDVYFPRINGVSTSILTFRRELRGNDHDVALIAPEYPGAAVENDVIRIPARRVPLDPEDRMMRLNGIYRLTERLREERFDVVHVQTPFVAHYAGVALARRLQLPVVETYHTYFEEYLYNYVPFVPKKALRFAARRFSMRQCNSVDGLVAPSGAMLDVLRGYGVRQHAAIIPTGIELMRFAHGDGAAFRRRHGIADDRPVLVHVGRIAHEKNIDFLLRVTARVRQSLPNALLVVAGEGPALKHLRRLGSELGLANNLLFVGYLDRESALLDCYSAGDAFIFASRTETQGLVLLEAMALGVPVVSTAVMGTREVLRDGAGALVAEERVDDFAAKAVTLLSDQTLRARLSEEARRYAHGWSAEARAAQLVDFYRDVRERHAHAAGRRRSNPGGSSEKPSAPGSGQQRGA